MYINLKNFRSECESEVKGFPGARYKKFATESEATSFITAAGSIGMCTFQKPYQVEV